MSIRKEFDDVHEAISKALWVEHTKALGEVPLEPVVSVLKFNGMNEAVRKLCALWGRPPVQEGPYMRQWHESAAFITYLATYNPPGPYEHPKCSVVQHFKGGFYLITGVSTCADTLEEKVDYVALADGKKWHRKLARFNGAVWVEDRFVPRFLQGSPVYPRMDVGFLKGKT